MITAIDTLAHVPDVAGTARQLHATMRPGGWLFANVDVRSDGAASAWHLQSDARRGPNSSCGGSASGPGPSSTGSPSTSAWTRRGAPAKSGYEP